MKGKTPAQVERGLRGTSAPKQDKETTAAQAPAPRRRETREEAPQPPPAPKRGVYSEATLDALLEDGAEICGYSLRPITLATIAMLKRTGNELVSGLPLDDCPNVMMHSAAFIVLQSVPLAEAIKLTKNPDALETRAFEVCDTLSYSEGRTMVEDCLNFLADSMGNRVEAVPEDEGDGSETLEGPDAGE